MNYQDTSSLTGTDARSDADVIPAGSNAPAVGNTITGVGTVTGADGADVIGSAPGQVVAVQGAGGADTSTSGEAMQVSGRYGVLNMEGDGSYRYTRNGDTPDGVRDVFTYTLADSADSRDTATLTIDIGREPVVVQADAQQVVVGPDGVVTLPAGVTLADIHVVGRNLVIDMPDGTQMVIVDGAVFVPQLVLGGVEVPSANVAALLIDSEPVPAAGNPQSSGGNFGLPPAPLDPGVPLGDLIPPVEQDYTPPIFEDVGQFVDDEPEIFIQPDGQPASVAAIDSVDERGLPTRNEGEPAGSGEISDGNGSNNSDTSETTTGVIIIDAQDTPATITITVDGTTTAITGTVPQVIQGQYGTLTITSVSDTQIGYSYTLADNTSGDTTHDDFLVTLTDSDGDVASATLRIDIIDDVPTARADVDSVTEDGPLVATGNILTGGTDAGDANTTDGVGDTTGADDADITAFSGTGGTGTFGNPLAGTYGSLVLSSNGGYVYTLNNQDAAVQGLDTGETLIETYSYTVTDGDGDTSTTTLTITINGANDAPVALNDTNWTVEDGGTISGNVLNNVPHNGAPDEQPRADVADTDIDGEDLDVAIIGSLNGTYGTLTLDAETGAYTYDLNDALPAVQALGVGDTLIETFQYNATDGTATDGATLTITIFGTNDAPIAVDDTNWTLEDGPNITGNVLADVAHNGAPDEQPRADVADTDVDGDTLTVSLNEPALGSYGTIVLNANGSYEYNLDDSLAVVQALGVGETLIETYSYTSDDGNGGTDTATLTITIFGTNDAPIAIDDTNWTVEDGGTISGNVLANVAHNGAPDDADRADVADTDVDGDDLDVTLDGSPVGTYGTLTLNAETGAYTYALNNALPAVQALGVGDTLIETYTYISSDGNGGSDTATLTITIFGTNDAPVARDDTNWTEEGAGAITGNVLNDVPHNGAPDGQPRADDNDSDVDGDDLDVSIVGSLVGTYGTLTLNSETGEYSYQVDNDDPAVSSLVDGATLIETYTYTASDGNGGTDTATLTITIFGTNDGPSALNDTNWTVEDGGTISGNVLANVAHNGAPDMQPRADVADTDPDGDDLDVSIIGSLNGAYGVLTLDAETGAYTYDLNDALPEIQALGVGDTLIETFQYNASDGTDSDGATLTITIFGTNDAPVAVDDTNWAVEDGPSITGNILANVAHNGAPDMQARADVADTDVDGDDLDVTIDEPLAGQYGTLTINTETGAYTYDVNDALPAVQALGVGETLIETYNYTASDGNGGSDTATLTITIFGTNDAPIAIDDTNWAVEDGPSITGNILANVAHNGAPDMQPRADVADTDVDGDDLDVTIDEPLVGTYGTLTINTETGAYTYDVNDAITTVQALGVGDTLIETYNYTSSDGNGGSDTATLTITIFGTNDAPDIQASSVTISEEGIALIANPDGVGNPTDTTNSASGGGTMVISDPDGDPISSVVFTSYPAGLTADGAPLVWSGLGTNTITGTASGTTLTLTINTSGQYTVTLSGGGLDHANNDGENLLNFSVNVQVSDGNGGTDTAALSVTVEDDSPVNFNPVDLTDTTNATATTLDDALVNDGTANVVRFINDTNMNPANGENFVGADGYGDLVFTATGHVDGEALENSGGTPLTSGSDPIYVFGYGTGVLTATTSADNSDPNAVVFTVTLTEGAGSGSASTYEIEFFQQIDDGGGFVFDDFSSAPAGQNDWVGLDADGLDINDPLDPNANSEDLLLTPTNVGGSINTSATDIGNSNQWIDDGEGVRLDYVVDVRRDPGSDEKDVGGYVFDGHYNVTDSSFTIMQTQGGGTAAVRITAYNDLDAGALDTLDGAIVPIDPASIVVTGDPTYTVTLLADGSVVVSGLAPGASVEFQTTGDVPFNAYSVTNADGVANPEGGTFASDAFALGVFGFNSETQGNPIDLSFDVTASDSDGDTSTGTIDVTLTPVDPSAMEAPSIKTSMSTLIAETEQQQAANTNTVLLGAIAGAGLMAAQSAAAAPAFDVSSGGLNGDFSHSSLLSSSSLQSVDHFELTSLFEGGMLARDGGTILANDSAGFSQQAVASEGLGGHASAEAPDVSQLPQGSEVPMASQAADAATFATGDVAMPSLEALMATVGQQGANAQEAGNVAQILADALAGGGGADIDGLLAGLPGNGGNAVDGLASHGMAGVSTWDMGAFGGYTALHQAFTMEALVLHQDGAIQQA